MKDFKEKKEPLKNLCVIANEVRRSPLLDYIRRLLRVARNDRVVILGFFKGSKKHKISASQVSFAFLAVLIGVILMTGCSSGNNIVDQKEKKPDKNKDKPYNVLFIAVDDMNDYVGLLRDFPGVKMPNVDQFAKTSVTFTHAYAAAPVCNPSRIAVLTGISPIRTDRMNNGDWYQRSPVAVAAKLLPETFHESGYTTMWSGKIFHTTRHRAQSRPDLGRLYAMWDDMTHHDGGYGPFPKVQHTPRKWWDWQMWTGSETQLPDAVNTNYTIKLLQKDYDKPFFIALGLYRPHTPLVVPKRFFEEHPLATIQHPEVLKNDLNDIPPIGKKYAAFGINLKNVKKRNEWNKLVRGYLSAISFTDYNIGRVLDALDNSPYRDSTIVVIWADNGLHLGEKYHFGKNALWEQDTHVLLMMRVPGMPGGGTRTQPVSLLDIYPTLVELCNLPQPDQTLDGMSLLPMLEDKNYDRKRPAISYYHKGNKPASVSIRTPKWRYIWYYDGTDELYNEIKDPNEWHNLANQSEYNDVIERLSQWLTQ